MAEAHIATADLDGLILAAERAVIERDQRLRGQARELRTSLRARASRGLAIGVGAVLGGLLLGALLWRGRGHTATAMRRHVGAPLARGRHALARLPALLKLLPLAWPLLPLRLRARMPAGTAALLVALGAPALARSARERLHDDLPPPATADDIDLERYLGEWYELARLPLAAESGCESDATATYSFDGEAIRIDNRCRHDDGHIEAVQGRAVLPDPDHPARLKVCFAPTWLRWLPLVWADYWILYVDADYRCALVGTPDHRHLWLLSRSPSVLPEELQRLFNEARDRGYDPARLVRTPQSSPLPTALH